MEVTVTFANSTWTEKFVNLPKSEAAEAAGVGISTSPARGAEGGKEAAATGSLAAIENKVSSFDTDEAPAGGTFIATLQTHQQRDTRT